MNTLNIYTYNTCYTHLTCNGSNSFILPVYIYIYIYIGILLYIYYNTILHRIIYSTII